jgi:hypothetical protein
MALSEIEKLERRYAENPQGLTFAPLAEVHRKNGELQRALDLLGPGLAIHPDYIPASIVLGRCHLDLGDVHAAETAFLHVLALDGENVIALKALADISERLLKFEDAERWLHNLLSVDRSNDEAREQLQRVEIARRQAEVASSAEPTSVLEAELSAAGNAPAQAESAGAVTDAAPVLAFEPPVAEPAMGWVSHSSRASEPPSPPVEDLEPSTLREPFDEPAGLELDEPVPYEEAVEPIDGLVGREVDEPDDLPGEFRVETSEDIILRSSGGNEFQVPDASLELFTGSAPPERAGLGEPASPPVVEPSAETEAEAEVPAASAEEPELALMMPEPELAPIMAEPEPTPEPEPFLAGELPSERFASERFAVTADPEPETVPAVTPQAPDTPKRTYAVSETGGRPVVALLKDILAAHPPAHAAPAAVRQAPASGSGAPTRPAADALSLSSVFGEESPGTPPAVPAPGSGSGVSFDDFFGAAGATPPQRGTKAPDPKNDDLDQFHAWLQNLKR